MAVSKFGKFDWLLGWLVPQGTAGAYVQAVALTSSTGAEYTPDNPLPIAAVTQAPFSVSGTASLAVTSTSASVLLVGTGSQVMVTSPSTNAAVAFITFNGVAATTDTPILPGTVQTFTVSAGTTVAAAIGTATTTLYFTRGSGS